MFENLLGQDEVAATLRAEIEEERLPPALLFSGRPGSGKTTAALELARALSCTGGSRAGEGPHPASVLASWNCPCPSCSRHRLLAHPDLALIGPRSFPEEIDAGLEMLGHSPGSASAYFFVRACRKLARRFDAILYEGEEARLAKAAPLLRELEETLDAVAPERAAKASLAKSSIEAAGKATAAAAKLEALVPDAPPVFMIRNLEFWARLAPMGRRKTVIIENADHMQEGSRNALLKILEEPPESVRFVLLTSRRNAMMTTILSRSRIYAFAPRSREGTAAVVSRIFRSEEDGPSVEAFLAARRAFPPTAARDQARLFLAAAAGRREYGGRAASAGRALASLAEATKDFGQKDERFSGSFASFLRALSELLSAGLASAGAADIAAYEKAAGLLRSAWSDYESLNRSPSLLSEALMYALGDIGLGSEALMYALGDVGIPRAAGGEA
jgi:DNA polymerase III subunit gamma/tau